MWQVPQLTTIKRACLTIKMKLIFDFARFFNTPQLINLITHDLLMHKII